MVDTILNLLRHWTNEIIQGCTLHYLEGESFIHICIRHTVPTTAWPIKKDLTYNIILLPLPMKNSSFIGKRPNKQT